MFQALYNANAKGNLINGENGAFAYKSASLSNDDLNGLLTEVFLLMRGETKDIINDKLLIVMGNIEIREESSAKRRPQIFASRKSFDGAQSDFRKSLTQRYSHSSRSPIRFSKHSELPQ